MDIKDVMVLILAYMNARNIATINIISGIIIYNLQSIMVGIKETYINLKNYYVENLD